MLAAAELKTFAQISSRSAENFRGGNIPSYLASSCAISDRSRSMAVSEAVKALISFFQFGGGDRRSQQPLARNRLHQGRYLYRREIGECVGTA